MALKLTDPYERPARLYPALIVVAPAIVALIVATPDTWAILKGLSSVVGGFGLTYLLAHWAREAGRRLQREMEGKDGRRSTVALRHRDDHVNKTTKARYHAALAAHGFAMPTAEDEARDPALADDVYASACDWLRERTRDRKAHPLIFQENVAYGFRRNLVALRPVAIAILIACLVGDAFAILHFVSEDVARMWAVAVVAAGSAGLLAAWAFVFSRKFVDDASWAYTDRLLAALEHLPAPARPNAQKGAPKAKKAPKTLIPSGENK